MCGTERVKIWRKFGDSDKNKSVISYRLDSALSGDMPTAHPWVDQDEISVCYEYESPCMTDNSVLLPVTLLQ